MQFSSTLYGGGITRDHLRNIRPNTVTERVQRMGSRHKPIPHIDFVEHLTGSIERAGFQIGREQFDLRGANEEQIFGVLDIVPQGEDIDAIAERDETVWSIGFRGSNDGVWARSLIAGRTVCVCSNGIFSGEAIVMHRKNTLGFRVAPALDAAVSRAIDEQGMLDRVLDSLKKTEIDHRRAKEILFDGVIEHGICAARYLPHVWNTYTGRVLRNDEGNDVAAKDATQADENLAAIAPDCVPRTAWGLHNAFTRTFRDRMKAGVRMPATENLGRFFGIGGSDEARFQRYALALN